MCLRLHDQREQNCSDGIHSVSDLMAVMDRFGGFECLSSRSCDVGLNAIAGIAAADSQD